MNNLYIYCEGQTEESFVKSLLVPYFASKKIFVKPIICRTKEGPAGIYRGGITDYNKAVREIKKLCTQHPNEFVTSFIDFYGLDNLPQINYLGTDKYELISQIENQFYSDVSNTNFIPYISLHEFESLLFSNPEEFTYLSNQAANKFKNILNDFNNNPELINCGRETAPSKRIKKEIPTFSKLANGTSIANRITLPIIREKCFHFSQWISKLEKIS